MGLLAGLYNPQRNRLFSPQPDLYVDPRTGGFLRAVYDYQTLADTFKLQDAFQNWEKNQLAGFIDLLPLEKIESLPDQRPGNTPLIAWDEEKNICLKQETENPTGSVAGRSLAVLLARARELNYETVCLFSDDLVQVDSFSEIIRDFSLRGLVFTSEGSKVAEGKLDLPENLILLEVKADRKDTYNFLLESAREREWYNITPGFNPYSREGYKTVAFELYLQWGEVPENIYLVPRQGNILSGLIKGFQELKIIGWTQEIPRFCLIFPAVEHKKFGWFKQALEESEENSNSKLSGIERGPVDLFYAVRMLREIDNKMILLERSPRQKEENCENRKSEFNSTLTQCPGELSMANRSELAGPGVLLSLASNFQRQPNCEGKTRVISPAPEELDSILNSFFGKQ